MNPWAVPPAGVNMPDTVTPSSFALDRPVGAGGDQRIENQLGRKV